MGTISGKDLDQRFKADVAAYPGGENIKLCYACGTCTAVCPMASANDEFNPRKIIRQVLLGMRREVLASPQLWQCIQCYACYAKCPQNVKFRDIIKALRAMAVQEGYAKADMAEELARFNECMLKLHREAAALLVADRPKYEALKQRICEHLASLES